MPIGCDNPYEISTQSLYNKLEIYWITISKLDHLEPRVVSQIHKIPNGIL